MSSLNFKLLFFVALTAFIWPTNAQEFNEFNKEVFIQDQDSLPYRIMLPKNMNPDITYPLVVFLHGSGERGFDNQLQLTHGASLFASDSIRTKFPAIVVFPQCPANASWHNGTFQYNNGQGSYNYPEKITYNTQQELLEGLITQLTTTTPVNSSKIYVGGLSMGAMGTFELVRRNPNLFAAAFAICGGANLSIVPKIKDTPWFIFHGMEDNVVPYTYSQAITKALQKAQAKVILKLYPGVGHDSWTNAFADPQLMPLLFMNSKQR